MEIRLRARRCGCRVRGDKIKDKIYNNRYKGSVEIPEDIKPGEDVWFEVKLSKQGLKGESNTIPGMPQPLLVKMQWDKQEARRGDILKLQAEFEQIEEEASTSELVERQAAINNDMLFNQYTVRTTE